MFFHIKIGLDIKNTPSTFMLKCRSNLRLPSFKLFSFFIYSLWIKIIHIYVNVGNLIPKNSTKNYFNYIIYGRSMQGTNLQKTVPFLAYFQLFCDFFSQKRKTGFTKKIHLCSTINRSLLSIFKQGGNLV